MKNSDTVSDKTSEISQLFHERLEQVTLKHIVIFKGDSHRYGFTPSPNSDHYLCVFFFDGKLNKLRRLSLFQEIVETAYELEVDVLPIIYDRFDWRLVQDESGKLVSADELFNNPYRQELSSQTKENGNILSDVRKRIVSSLQANISFLEDSLMSVSAHHELHFPSVIRIVEDAFEYLFTIFDFEYFCDQRDIPQFETILRTVGLFKKSDAYLLRYLVTLEEHSRHGRYTSIDVECRLYKQSIDSVIDFLKNVKVLYKYGIMTVEETRSRRRKRNILVASCLFVVAVLVGVVLYTSSPDSIGEPVQIPGKVGGIGVSYYKGKEFNKFIAKGSTKTILVPRTSSPHKGVSPNLYSVRWEGYLKIEKDGEQFLCVESDDGVRVFLNEKILIDDWSVHRSRKKCQSISVEKKGWYPLQLEFFEDKGMALVNLSLGENEKSATPVKSSQLCCKKKENGEQKKKEK